MPATIVVLPSARRWCDVKTVVQCAVAAVVGLLIIAFVPIGEWLLALSRLIGGR